MIQTRRQEAADQEILASMVLFAQEHRGNACIGIITADKGFARTLLYCRSLGCHTLAVTKYAPTSRSYQALE